jgi:hypothetical protein
VAVVNDRHVGAQDEIDPGFSVAKFVRAHSGRPDICNPIGDQLRRVGLPD